MKIKSIRVKNIRRFSDLTIENLPQTAKLVVLIGQNGSGKSSLFDVLRKWQTFSFEDDFHGKNFAKNSEPAITFHSARDVSDRDFRRKAIYLRTSYRNDPTFSVDRFEKLGSMLDESRPARTIDNDVTVSTNYKRLIGESIKELFSKDSGDEKVKTVRERLIGKVRESMLRVFPDLLLSGAGNPIEDGAFYFEKGQSKNFHYKNLSGGEKAAFDLILDFVTKTAEFNDTIFCIDEPESHMHTSLQRSLLRELLHLIPRNSQLWIATHSIGMMRCALDLYSAEPGSVIFIDFHDKNFDEALTISPAIPDRAFWQKILKVALDDLGELVVPKEVVLCEGHRKGSAKKAEFDATCLGRIFSKEYPELDFISVGNVDQVQQDSLGIGISISKIAKGVKVTRLIDRDDRSPDEIRDLISQGVKVLSRRQIESYLWDDEVLAELCKVTGKPDKLPLLVASKQQAIQSAVSRGRPADDMKAASGEAYLAAKNLLTLTGCGNSSDAFMRDTLAPLLSSTLTVYSQLKSDIFGGR